MFTLETHKIYKTQDKNRKLSEKIHSTKKKKFLVTNPTGWLEYSFLKSLHFDKFLPVLFSKPRKPNSYSHTYLFLHNVTTLRTRKLCVCTTGKYLPRELFTYFVLCSIFLYLRLRKKTGLEFYKVGAKKVSWLLKRISTSAHQYVSIAIHAATCWMQIVENNTDSAYIRSIQSNDGFFWDSILKTRKKLCVFSREARIRRAYSGKKRPSRIKAIGFNSLPCLV